MSTSGNSFYTVFMYGSLMSIATAGIPTLCSSGIMTEVSKFLKGETFMDDLTLVAMKVN